jgi:hypothetical protein
MDLKILSKEDYYVYKESDDNSGPHILTINQQYPNDIYVNVPKEEQKIPFAIQLYIGGLSVIGLYITYRLIKRASRD